MLKFLLVLMVMLDTAIAAPAATCPVQKLQEVLKTATPQQPSVYIDCSLTLPKNARITKQLIFAGIQASGVIFDGNGAEIHATHAQPSVLVTSIQQAGQWQVPQNIQIKNVRIIGSLRIHGMAANGQDKLLKQSSYHEGHTAQAQQAAPHHMVLDKLTLLAGKRNMMYFAPGVHHITLKNSHFSGNTDGLALYLDAESAHNIIENNTFDVHTKARETIAVDGSAHNIIRHNQFIQPNHGAIYLYRNCGEGGTVRHQAPEHNQIMHNDFELAAASKTPLIWIASRNGHRSYCDADKGYAFGSSINDQDLARHNTISHNRFDLKGVPKLFVWMTNLKQHLIRVDGHPNEIKCNQMLD